MGPFVFLDIETTGIDPSRNNIIEIACLKWKDFQIVERFESLVNPRVPIPKEIVILTGITDSLIQKAPLFFEIKEKIIQFVGDMTVIGHNISFDTSFLKSHHFEIRNPEIDTLALTRILLLKEPSYALEVLMKKYGLPTRDSHRAMADVETTTAFFEFLLQKMDDILPNVWNILKSVLEKSEWAGREVFLRRRQDCSQRNGSAASVIPRLDRGISIDLPLSRKMTIQRSFQAITGGASWSKETINAFLQGQKILLESPARIHFESLKNTPLLIAYSSIRKRDELAAAGREAGLSIAHLKEPFFYLSPKKLKALLLKEKISAALTPFLLKMMLWESCTITGDREEISFEREEYGFFDLIADDDGEDIWFQKALAEALNSSVVLVHQYALSHRLHEYLFERKWGLIIVEASRLEDSLTNAGKKKYTEARLRPFFQEKATVIFGLMGIFYEHFVQKEYGGYRGAVILDSVLRSSIQWKRILDAVSHLPDHPKKTEFLEDLDREDNVVSWITLFVNELSFTSAPISIATEFQASIKPFPHVLLQSDALSGDGSFHYIREIFELDSNWKEIKEQAAEVHSNIEIIIPKNFPEPHTEGYFKKCLSLFNEIIEKKTGKSLFLLSSKKAVDAFFSALLPKAAEHGIKLLAVGASGGMGKSLALFKENPDRCILLGVSQLIPYLYETQEHIETIVFQKIPFDAPGDPVYKIRSSWFTNGFNEYTLPRAIIKFRELLAEFARGKAKTCYILDSRIMNREYGRMFI